MADKPCAEVAAIDAGRRVLIARAAMCATGLLCLGCSRATAAGPQAVGGGPPQPEKFGADSKMTFKQVYDFAFTGYISTLKALGEDIGRDKFLPMLQAAASRGAAAMVKQAAPPPPKNTLAAFVDLQPEYFWSHVLTFQWVERTERAAEIRVTECLWAATFRAAGAADIGYASTCHPDFATTTAFNPKMRMQRTKTLMQGHDCCNHRYVIEA